MNQHQFSIDPIGAIDNIKEAAIRYLRWAYRINNAALEKERVDLLSRDGNLFQSPYMELLPEYAQHPHIKDISQFAGFHPEITWMTEFFDFIKMGLMNYPPYRHQVEMLEKAFINGKSTVITSGTGSGKTESFLLPVFAQIYREAKSWEAVSTPNPGWFNENPYSPCQRKGETRTAAVRAMILYPMNALVEDQMARLRKALDSDDVRAHFDSLLGGNRIYFGRYIGGTMGKKSYSILADNSSARDFDRKREHISNELSVLHEKYTKILDLWNSLSQDKKDEQPDIPYISPRLDGQSATAEMLTRWDMQDTPPDIMVTNTSMLSIMLMRKAESGIFDRTREWLKESPDNVFQLVVDELHLYRGTAGSEVACLLRMLYDALGLDPVVSDGEGHLTPNPQLRILASSASLGDAAATQKFMAEFFGIYDSNGNSVFEIQDGYYYIPTLPSLDIPYDEFSFFTPAFIDMDETGKRQEADKFARNLGFADIADFIENTQSNIFNDLKKWFGKTARKFDEMYDVNDNGLFHSMDAARGFLIFRGYADSVKKTNKLPRIRFHQFFKFIEGLWGELSSSAPFISSLSYTAHESGSKNNKMLELLRCESCGELYIGGNRKEGIDDPYPSITLNYPDLSQIPSSNPTPMVQNKSYTDYVVFWPTLTTELPEGLDHHVIMHSGPNKYTDYTKTGAQSEWVHAYLNPVNGKLESRANPGYNIPGWVYRVKPYKKGMPDYSKIPALPCQCPVCSQNFTRRKYTDSPIRSFRVGIDRMNQLLSKELIHQLSEKSPKLVGFSDSRNDAARQSFGIELEHYRDMVRKTMLDHVGLIHLLTTGQIENEIRDLRAKGMNDRPIKKEIKGRHPEIVTDLLDDIIEVAFDIIDDPNVTQASMDALYKGIPLQYVIPAIEKRLVTLGINPGGVDFSKQYTQDSRHWSTLFDLNTGMLQPNVAPNELYADIKDTLIAAVFANSFGKYMGVNTIDSGMGYMGCIRDNKITNSTSFQNLKRILHINNDDDVYDFVDAYIRILGDNYRYHNNDFDSNNIESYDAASATLKLPIRKYAEDHGINEKILGNAIYELLHMRPTDKNTYLHPNGLSFFPSGDNDTYFRCDTCHRIHLTKGMGFCTNTSCAHPLPAQPSGLVRDLWDHFVAHDIKESPRDARRLHTEELTGQTDNGPERLLHFKGIVLEGEQKAKEIDMVNVTTTMEVGVDIGSLQAVYQGNMPPTRYNYQQRVGRGGRRGQAFSAAFTFCRGRSHDSYYYLHNLEHMVSAVPPAPTLSLAPFAYTDVYGNNVSALKTSIFRRVVVKSVFRKAIGTQMFDYNLVDTAGEFGRVCQWKDDRRIVETWIRKNGSEVRDIINMYMRQFDETYPNEVDRMVDWVKNDMLDEIEVQIPGANNPEVGLAQFLAEKGFLPKYGLPFEVRPFYHRYSPDQDKLFKIDREVEISITEFAPEQEIVKDKGKFVVKAITCPMNATKNHGGIFFKFINPAGNDALADSYGVALSGNEVTTITNDPEEKGITTRLVIPKAYRTKVLLNNNGREIENNDSRSSNSSSLIFASHTNNTAAPTILMNNLEAILYGTNVADAAEIWHVNTNHGRLFTGSYELPTDSMKGKNVRGNVMTETTGTFFFDNRAGDDAISIALGSKKATEMICLKLLNIPQNLNLDVRSGHRAAILAAFYSAATLLQRCLADKLDVEPEEIEISLRTDQVTGIPRIYLSDSLPNGANLVGYLFEDDKLKLLLEEIANSSCSFMKGVTSPGHVCNCKTSCHDCLNTYSNRGLHHVLDWRMGVGIIRLMLDQPYDFGMTIIDPSYFELADMAAIRDICATRLGMPQGSTSDSVRRGFSNEIRSIWHPLWNTSVAGNMLQPGEVELYDTFSVMRSDLSGMGSVQVPANQDTGGGNHILVRNAAHDTTKNPAVPSEKRVDPETNIIF